MVCFTLCSLTEVLILLLDRQNRMTWKKFLSLNYQHQLVGASNFKHVFFWATEHSVNKFRLAYYSNETLRNSHKKLKSLDFSISKNHGLVFVFPHYSNFSSGQKLQKLRNEEIKRAGKISALGLRRYSQRILNGWVAAWLTRIGHMVWQKIMFCLIFNSLSKTQH